MVGPACRSYALLWAEARGVYQHLPACPACLLHYLGELETLVMLRRYAYHKSSGLFVVVRRCNTGVEHQGAL